MRTLLFVVVVGVLMTVSLVFYGLSRNVYAQFDKAVLGGLSKESAEYAAYISQHRTLSFLAYLFSILALAGFGVCLHISDKMREVEDKKVETMEIPAPKDEDEKVVESLEKEAVEKPVQ
ncbi:MAG: hypothetical protein K6F32_00295 [Bacilli bacterium]|nr:hypothetical protein [Bacilli bacterium]